MAKKGALKSVYIVNDDDLRVNGGRWLLQSGPAIRVRGFTADTLGDRKVTGGDALPIYVLGENDIRANGGQFLLKGGQPISVTSAIATARGVIQGKAIPVWPVDDDGNFDSDFAGGYSARVLATEPDDLILYHIMGESSGAVAIDSSPQGNNGAYTGVTLGQPGIGDGNTAPFFDGATSFNNFFSAGFDADFNGNEATILIWVKMFNVAAWSGTGYAFSIYADASNRFVSWNSAPNNFAVRRVGGGTSHIITALGVGPSLDWFMMTVTASEIANETIGYINGVPIAPASTPIGAYVGALDNTRTLSGAVTTLPGSVHHGNLAHLAVWKTPLTPAQILELATV